MNWIRNIQKERREHWLEMQRKNMNAIKNTYYSGIYVVVCFFEQTFVLELLKDMKLCDVAYFFLGAFTIGITLYICKKLIDRSRNEIEKRNEYIKSENSKIIECATMLGYMSPLLCVASWFSSFSFVRSTSLKWGINILALILGIIIPVTMKKEK